MNYLSIWLLVLSFLAPLAAREASAETLDGFVLAKWNTMKCQPKVLRPGDTLRLRLPRARSDEIGIFTPANKFATLAEALLVNGQWHNPLRPGGTFQSKISTARDVSSADHHRIFVQPGSYVILVGHQFGTETPVVSGWCRVTYRASGLTK